ncbi:MAG: agglutinin biogenesis protein MshI [Betaproteobacteria bacterium]|nr:agglutinin biogenesis protein MshI [Betaproteobacteria bacterium]
MVALRAEADKVRYVHADATDPGKPVVLSFGLATWRGDAGSLARAYKEFGLGKNARCATLLAAGDYQISAVEAPNVPEAELSTAMRWRMKEVIDYPVEQATYDLLEIPAVEGAAGRSRWIYVIAARSERVKTYVDRFDEAKVPLAVIDIPETAQRNIAALYERESKGVGLLYFDAAGGLLTVTSGGELYLARRFDFTESQIRQDNEAYRDDLYSRILVELQRTLDNFERQHGHIVLARIMLGPEPEPAPLAAYLQSNLGVEVAEVALEEVMQFRGGAPDAKTQWEYFHLIGCAIRSEGPSP